MMPEINVEKKFDRRGNLISENLTDFVYVHVNEYFHTPFVRW